MLTRRLFNKGLFPRARQSKKRKTMKGGQKVDAFIKAVTFFVVASAVLYLVFIVALVVCAVFGVSLPT